MSERTTSKTVTLTSDDGVVFVVPEIVAKQSQILRPIIDDPNRSSYFLLQHVNGPILAKVIEYCTKHVDAAEALRNETAEEGTSTTPASSRLSDEELRNWDKQFVDVDPATLCDLTIVADNLKIDGLRKVLCKKVADTIKGNSEAENMQFLKKWATPGKYC